MGGLFGGGRQPAPRVATQGTALEQEPRPMPDPGSGAARQAARQERRKIIARSGRTSTDLTRGFASLGRRSNGTDTPRTPTALG